MSARWRGLAAVIPGLLFVNPAQAQETAEGRARSAFSRGLEAEKGGDTVGACAAFRESLALVREFGPLRKAKDCDVAERKLLSGRALLEELRGRATDEAQRVAFEAELAQVNGRVPRLTVTVAAGVKPARVTLDGVAISLPLRDRELDPGPHELVLETQDQRLLRTPVALAEGEKKSVELAEPAALAPVATKPPPPTSLGITGFVLGGVGLVGVGGAVVTGIMALDRRDALDACATDCDAIADEGNTLLVLNGVAWGVGALGLGLGGTFVLLDYTAGDGAPEVTARFAPGAFALEGRF